MNLIAVASIGIHWDRKSSPPGILSNVLSILLCEKGLLVFMCCGGSQWCAPCDPWVQFNVLKPGSVTRPNR